MAWPIWFSTRQPSPQPPPAFFPVLERPEVRVWVERSDGTRIDEIRDPALTDPTWRRNDVGEVTVEVPLDDLGIGSLLRTSGGETLITNWEYDDIEVAIYRQGANVWRGPVVDAEHSRGLATLYCWSQEGYLARQIIGGPYRVNYLAPDFFGNSAGYFDLDPTLARWDIDPGVDAETITGPERYLWRRDRSLRLFSGTANLRIEADADLPVGTIQNYVDVIVRVKLAAGAVLPFGLAVGEVQHYTAEPSEGGLAYGTRGDPYPLLLDEDYVAETWATVTLRLPQIANMHNRYEVRLIAPTGFGSMYVGEVEVVRDENVSVPAGGDIGTLMAALYRHLIRLMGPGWTRRNASAGTDVVDAVRYLSRDHVGAREILDAYTINGDWWVELDRNTGMKVMVWGPRGRTISDLILSSDILADWRVRWTGSEAVTELVGGAPGNDGPTREEYSAVRPGMPHRLPARLLFTGGLSMRDLANRTEAEILTMGTKVEMSGVPVGPDGTWPGEILAQVGLGDRADVRVQDGPLDYTIPVKVEQLSWNPITDRVTPGWAQRTGD